MTAVAKLLPCPFCGEPGEFAGCEQDGHYVRCSGRGCYGEVGENYDGCAMPSHMFSSQEDAAAAWNRRASPAELGGVVLFHRLHQPNYSSEWIRGDYTGPESTQRGWSVERVYATPRAAEASDAAALRLDDYLCNEHGICIGKKAAIAALAFALTPPSAKGENSNG